MAGAYGQFQLAKKKLDARIKGVESDIKQVKKGIFMNEYQANAIRRYENWKKRFTAFTTGKRLPRKDIFIFSRRKKTPTSFDSDVLYERYRYNPDRADQNVEGAYALQKDSQAFLDALREYIPFFVFQYGYTIRKASEKYSERWTLDVAKKMMDEYASLFENLTTLTVYDPLPEPFGVLGQTVKEQRAFVFANVNKYILKTQREQETVGSHLANCYAAIRDLDVQELPQYFASYNALNGQQDVADIIVQEAETAAVYLDDYRTLLGQYLEGTVSAQDVVASVDFLQDICPDDYDAFIQDQ